jgi:hypothetical protein
VHRGQKQLSKLISRLFLSDYAPPINFEARTSGPDISSVSRMIAEYSKCSVDCLFDRFVRSSALPERELFMKRTEQWDDVGSSR